MIRFSCENCGQRYKAEPSFAGEDIECRKCGTDVPVPSAVQKPVEQKEVKAPKISLSSSMAQGEIKTPKLSLASSSAQEEIKAPKLSLPPSISKKLRQSQ